MISRPVIRLLTVFALLASLAGCTRTVEAGQYGPFTIGASKEATLAALERANIRGVEPLVDPPIHLLNPTRADFDALRTASGIAVIAEEGEIQLRIEFDGDTLASSSPNFKEYPYIPRYPYSSLALLAQMQLKLSRGLDRSAVFDALASFKTEQKIEVEAFVAGYELYRRTDSKPWIEPYRSVLLAGDEWRFQGLKDEVWYPVRKSGVALHFREGRLTRLEDQTGLF